MMARNSGDFPKTLSKDANPIALLMDLKDVLNGHIASLKDNTLITLSNMKLDKIIQMDISHAKATLEFCSRYIATFMEKVEELSLVLIATVRKLTDKLSKEFEDFVSDPDGRQMTEKELEMLMGNTKVFKDFSEMAAVLAALQEMTAKIHEAAGKVAVELFQKRQEAENARAVVEALEEEMQIKANEERKQKEQEKQLMEEERKRKEEEERKRLEEEERRRVEEEEERRHVEEEEKRRRVEEEEKRRRVEEEEKRRRVEEEEERRRVEEEEKRRRVEEEEERRRVEEEEERRRVEEEEERRHVEEEEKRRRVEEEEKRRRVEEEEKRRRVEEEEERRRVEEEEKRRRVEEEEERRRVEEEEERRHVEEEEKRRRVEEEEKRRRVEEEEKRRRVEEEEERRRVEEEEKRRRVEEEEERRRVEEEEERRRVEEEEQRKREEKEERLRQEAEDMKRKEEDERLKREEEARKRREQEEKLKQEQEEAKRKKEKEERDRLEEEKRQRKNPANWPIFIYKVQDNDNTGTGIGCVIRAPAGNMQEADVTVSVADQVTSSFALGENEELVSNLIHIKVNRSDNFFFEFAPLLALPDCKEAAPYARETVIKICTDGVTWSELPSTDVKIPGLMEQRKLRLVEASINSLCTMTVAAVSKPKSTWEEITSWGKQIIWQVDKRVNITIPKQAVRLKATMGLQVQPIPLSTIASVRNEGVTTQNLMASTPLVSVESDGKFQKPVRVSVPTPRSNTSRASTSMVGRATRSAPSGNEQTFLAWRLQGKDWQHANAVELVQQADSYIFDLNMQAGPCRFILLKLEGAKPSDVPDIAEKLETAMRQREVNIILCQKSTDMHSAVIDVCSTEKADTVLNTFTEQGFDVGPLKSETLVIHEGQIIEVKFSGNITKDAEHDICFAFNSNLTSAKRQFHLKAKDQYAQHGQSLYRGYAEFWTPGIDTRIQQTVRVDRWGSEHQVTHEEERRLNFLPLTLPRVTRKSYVKKASNSFAAEGILTEQYLEHLSTVLVDDWVHLAKELGVQKSKLRPHEGPQSTERTIKDMLVMWYKGTAISADKVGALLKALRKVGRDDLAQELDERNNPLPSDTIEEAKLTKAFKSVLASPDALERWRFLARSLEVSEAIITDLRVTNGNSLINQCDAMLRRWKEMKGQGATRVVLQKALRECGMLKTAEDVLEM